MSKELKLRFYPKAHSYWYGKKKLDSVTRFIGSFMSKFDADLISTNISRGFKYRNRLKLSKGVEVTDLEKKKATKRYWKNEWKEAANHGTRVHNALEKAGLKLEFEEVTSGLVSERDTNKFEQGLKYLFKHEAINVEPEVKMHNVDYLLAGTIDLLIRNPDGTVSLADWKTNKEIKSTGKDSCYGILSDLIDCNYTKYAIQLCIYAYMLELEGETIQDLTIVHLLEDDSTEYPVNYELYKPYVIQMFKERKNGLHN